MGLSLVVFLWVLPLPHPGSLVLIALPKAPGDSAGGLGLLQACPARRVPAVEEGGGEVAGAVGMLMGLGRAGRKLGAGEAAWPRIHRHLLKLVAFLFGF